MAQSNPGLFGDSFAFDVMIDDTTKLPVIVAPEKSVPKAILNTVVGVIDGGKSASVGMGHTLGHVALQWAGATVRNMVNGDTRVRLNAWSQV